MGLVHNLVWSLFAGRRRHPPATPRRQSGRSYWNILTANLFSFFNLILFAVTLILLAFGRYNDALITGVTALISALIRTIQEIRAKRQLDQIALLVHPHALVVRNGVERAVEAVELAEGDIIHLRPGDQALADGIVVSQGVAEVDESLLTGESDLVRKTAGDRIYSGCFCVSGDLTYRAEAVGAESYANRLADDARTYAHSSTPLEQQITLIIRLLMVMTVCMALVFYIGGLLDNSSTLYYVTGSAVLIGLVPYGFFLTISVAYTLGAVTVARQGAIVQHSQVVEGLQHIDLLCLDKTGTLTTNRLQLHALQPAGGVDKDTLQRVAGDFACSVADANPTIVALRAGLGGRPRSLADEVRFASARKWSAVAFSDGPDKGVYVLGAWEMLRDHVAGTMHTALAQQTQEWSKQGLRVLLFARGSDAATLHDATGEPQLPQLQALGLVSLRDELRPHAGALLQEFSRIGVSVKIISGDSPHTVAALAKQVGIVAPQLTSGPELAAMSATEFHQTALDATIFGRIAPEQKAQLVEAMRTPGHYVAMIGDGVNDILAMKRANLSIAMQSGSNATRAIADMVLRDDSYQALAPALVESRRVVNGLTNISYLMLARSFTYALVIIGVLMAGLDFPFEPAQTGVTLLTVGLPAVLLTLWARPEVKTEPLLPAVVRFVLPVALWSALIGVTLFAYVYFRASSALQHEHLMPGLVLRFEQYTGLDSTAGQEFRFSASRIVAQTALSVFLSLSALLMILFLEPPARFFTGWRPLSPDRRPLWLVLGLILLLVIALYIEPVAVYLGFIPLIGANWREIFVALVIWGLGLRLLWRKGWVDRLLNVS